MAEEKIGILQSIKPIEYEKPKIPDRDSPWILCRACDNHISEFITKANGKPQYYFTDNNLYICYFPEGDEIPSYKALAASLELEFMEYDKAVKGWAFEELTVSNKQTWVVFEDELKK